MQLPLGGVLVEPVHLEEVAVEGGVLELGHDHPGQRERLPLVARAVELSAGVDPPAQLAAAAAHGVLDLLEHGASVAVRLRFVVDLAAGGGGVHEVTVGQGLAGHRAVPVVAHCELLRQGAQHRHLVRCVGDHDLPRIGGGVAEGVGAVEHRVLVVVREALIDRVGRVDVTHVVDAEELVVGVLVALSGVGRRQVVAHRRWLRVLPRLGAEGLAVLADGHLLDERQAVAVDVVQGVPQAPVKPLEVLSAGRRLVVVKPAQQVVKGPVF